MKPIMLIALAATLALSSCCHDKTYTCICTGGIAGNTIKTDIQAKNRSQAENDCAAKSDPANLSDGYKCHLQ